MALDLRDLSSPAIVFDTTEAHGADDYAVWPAEDDGQEVFIRVPVGALWAATARAIPRTGENVWAALLENRQMIAERARALYRPGDTVITLGAGDLDGAVPQGGIPG
jgi:hypothetical protein